MTEEHKIKALPVEQYAAVREHMAEVVKRIEAAMAEGSLIAIAMSSVRLSGDMPDNVSVNTWIEGTVRNTLRLTEETQAWILNKVQDGQNDN